MNIYRINSTIINIKTHKQVWTPSGFTLGLADILTRYAFDNTKVLDFGVGSGFLSILAGKLGAKEVVGLDLNPSAIKISQQNWHLNESTNISAFTAIQSNCFKQFPKTYNQYFDFIVSNPPTAPEKMIINKMKRNDAWLWNENGPEGRLVLDALLKEGHKYLKSGGKLIFINTSKQGFNQTKDLLDKNYSSWTIIKEELLLLADYYQDYMKFWEAAEKKTGEKRIYNQKNNLYQKLSYIEAINV